MQATATSDWIAELAQTLRLNEVFAAVLGHPYGANEERGIFRSSDGGQTWQKVLYRDENTGGMDLAFAPANIFGDFRKRCGKASLFIEGRNHNGKLRSLPTVQSYG